MPSLALMNAILLPSGDQVGVSSCLLLSLLWVPLALTTQISLVARPRVQLLSDDGTRRGEIRVAANVVDERGGRPAAAEPMPASSDTMVFDRPAAGDAPESARRAYLLVSTRGSRPVQFDLGGPLIGIGRASDNDVIVDDPMVSRHHCQLKLQHGAYSFTDLGSRNGSTVNGQPVSTIALGPGDVIRVGDTEIEFQVRQ